MTTTTAEDRALLARAIAVATTAAGQTAPNPNVGCVIAAHGAIMSEGATGPGGGPHAEVVALALAGDAARDATAYVTLEPCAHHGRTPPCVDALVAAGIARVVVAHEDPHVVASGGLDRLRAAGRPPRRRPAIRCATRLPANSKASSRWCVAAART